MSREDYQDVVGEKSGTLDKEIIGILLMIRWEVLRCMDKLTIIIMNGLYNGMGHHTTNSFSKVETTTIGLLQIKIRFMVFMKIKEGG